MKKWYAVMRDNDDNDWDYGSHDWNTAEKMLDDMRERGNAAAYIAVIAIFGDDPNTAICVAEIR